MFLSERLVYLELQKTGSTHCRNLLQELVGGELLGKHNQLSRKHLNGAAVLGSVRNPWDWYLSLWSYGCEAKGALFKATSRRWGSLRGLDLDVYSFRMFLHLHRCITRNAKIWKAVYSDVEDVNAFRQWLQLIGDQNHAYALGEGFGGCRLSSFAGLMTYRYLKLYCAFLRENEGLRKLSSLEEIREYESKNCFVNHFIKTENLEHDFFDAMAKIGVSISKEQAFEIRSRPRSNQSQRRLAASEYYDAGSEQWVLERDPIIIEKFGYLPPSLRFSTQSQVLRKRIPDGA